MDKTKKEIQEYLKDYEKGVEKFLKNIAGTPNEKKYKSVALGELQAISEFRWFLNKK